MRILLVGPAPPEVRPSNPAGGVATHAWELARHLAAAGDQVVFLDEGCRIAKRMWRRGVLVVPSFNRSLNPGRLPRCVRAASVLVEWYGGGPKRALGFVARCAAYTALLRWFRPEVVHVHHTINPYIGIHALCAPHVPLVITAHSWSIVMFAGSDGERTRALQIVNRHLRLVKPRNLILVSQTMVHQAAELGVDLPSGYRVVENPVDVQKWSGAVARDVARARLGLPQGSKVILFVGSLIPRKGVLTLLGAAFRLLSEGRRDLVFAIVGDGPERARAEELLCSRSCTEHFRFFGQISHDELPLYYRAADVLAVPTFGESFGLVYVEAYLCGIPVIGTTCVPAEVIPAADYGYRVPPGDEGALVAAIVEALSRRWDVAKLVEFGRSFGWDERLRTYREIYQEARLGS